MPREPACSDAAGEEQACANWAKGGECTKNPGFMKANCMRECDACAPALYDGKQATALVSDAWEGEEGG